MFLSNFYRSFCSNNNVIYTTEQLEKLTISQLRELAQEYQTFPDDFNFVIRSSARSRKKFELSPSQGYKLVGNAVPPLLAYHIAKRIESNWSLYFGS